MSISRLFVVLFSLFFASSVFAGETWWVGAGGIGQVNPSCGGTASFGGQDYPVTFIIHPIDPNQGLCGFWANGQLYAGPGGEGFARRSCPDDLLYSDVLQICVSPDVPPTTGGDENCDGDEEQMSIKVGDSLHLFCAAVLDNPCESVAHYWEGSAACQEDIDDCSSAGGSFGYVGQNPVCIPPFNDVGGEIPQPEGCASGEVVTAGADGYACDGPVTPKGDPEGEVPGVTPTQGITTKTVTTTKITGDPGSEVEEVTVETVETEEEGSSVGGGGDCNVPPTCDGDAILCSINFQTWKGRCATEKRSKEDEKAKGKGVSYVDSAGFGEEAKTLLEDVTLEYETLFETVKTEASSLVDISVSSGGSIVANVVTTKWGEVDMSWAKFTAQLAPIGGYIIALAYLLAAIIILRK